MAARNCKNSKQGRWGRASSFFTPPILCLGLGKSRQLRPPPCRPHRHPPPSCRVDGTWPPCLVRIYRVKALLPWACRAVRPGLCSPTWAPTQRPGRPGSAPWPRAPDAHATQPSLGVSEYPACGCAAATVPSAETPRPFCPQAGEKHYHPLCALCVRCGRMFAEGEEMYLQGKHRTMPVGSLGPGESWRVPCGGPCTSWEAGHAARGAGGAEPERRVGWGAAWEGQSPWDLAMAWTWRGRQGCSDLPPEDGPLLCGHRFSSMLCLSRVSLEARWRMAEPRTGRSVSSRSGHLGRRVGQACLSELNSRAEVSEDSLVSGVPSCSSSLCLRAGERRPWRVPLPALCCSDVWPGGAPAAGIAPAVNSAFGPS